MYGYDEVSGKDICNPLDRSLGCLSCFYKSDDLARAVSAPHFGSPEPERSHSVNGSPQ